MMTTARNSPRRHLFQFRLRTLLGLMATVSGLMAWCYHFHSNRKQWAAYEQVADKVQFSSTAPGRTVWLAPLAERKAYWEFTGINFRPSLEVNDDDLAHIAQMPRLTQLWLNQTAVTDRGLARLEHLTEMTALSLKDTAVKDQGLARLHRLSNLKDLRLSGTRVTSSGLALLKNHPRLEHLELARTAIRDEDLIHLAWLSKLRHLDLSKTQITGDGLNVLTSLKQLRCLVLRCDHLQRVVLADMPNLTTVHISGRRPLAMVSLTRMNALHTLSIKNPHFGLGTLKA